MKSSARPATPPVVILLGPPGSGKGTVGRALCRVLSGNHLSTGELLRSAAMNGDTALAGTIDSGEMVDLSTIEELLFEAIGCAMPNRQCLVLDGYPRQLDQCQRLDDVLAPQEVTLAVLLRLSAKVALRRLERRLTCEQCAMPSSLARSSRCPDCGGPLLRRADDLSTTAILRRFAHYEREVGPIVAEYRHRDRLLEVNADRPLDEVVGAIVEHQLVQQRFQLQQQRPQVLDDTESIFGV